ncbi:MAG: hypothetical protein LC776_02090, partial [Acidobacteria bacterium]|nr:hypothetical protein [Acidobacteriota bacterium]
NRFNDFAKKALARICVLTSFFIASMIFVYSFFAFFDFSDRLLRGLVEFYLFVERFSMRGAED